MALVKLRLKARLPRNALGVGVRVNSEGIRAGLRVAIPVSIWVSIELTLRVRVRSRVNSM